MLDTVRKNPSDDLDCAACLGVSPDVSFILVLLILSVAFLSRDRGLVSHLMTNQRVGG